MYLIVTLVVLVVGYIIYVGIFDILQRMLIKKFSTEPLK